MAFTVLLSIIYSVALITLIIGLVKKIKILKYFLENKQGF